MNDQDLSTSQSLDRRLAVALLIAMLVMAGFFASPMFHNRIPTHGDLGTFNLPMRSFYSQCLKQGDAFDWMPEIFGGYFLTGEGQHGPYHPAHLLMYRWLPLLTAYCLEVFLPVVVLAVGMILFLRRYVCFAGACLGALVATFSAHFLIILQHPQMATILAHIPWLLWVIDIAVIDVAGGKIRWGAVGIAAVVGSGALLGHPQAFWFLLFTGSLYALWKLATERAGWKAWAAVIGGMSLGLSLGAVQLFATYSLYSNSGRTLGSPLNCCIQGFDGWASWGILAPYLIGWSDHIGAVPLMLTLWWITAYRCGTTVSPTANGDPISSCMQLKQPDATIRRLSLWAMVLIAVTYWLSFGLPGKLYYAMVWLPVVGRFRIPFRFIVVTQILLAIPTALAFTRLLVMAKNGRKAAWRTMILPWLAVVASAVLAAFWAGQNDLNYWSVLCQGPSHTGIWLLVGTAAAMTLASRGRKIGVAILVAIAIFDVSIYAVGSRYAGKIYWRKLFTYQEYLDLYAGPPASPQGRIYENNPEGLSWMHIDRMCLHGYWLLDGCAAMPPIRILDYGHVNSLRVADTHWWRDPELPVPDGLCRIRCRECVC